METGKDTNSAFGLRAAIREVKIAAADRSDVVVDMKEADRARLGLLADSLADVIADVPVDDDRFDFAISSGLQPRFWIDATAHVMMGRDSRTYRFVRDTRLGRVVLAESVKPEPVADAVTRYVAERLVEREQIFAGETASLRPTQSAIAATTSKADAEAIETSPSTTGRAPLLPIAATTSSASEPQIPARHKRSQAEPTVARAIGSLLWILAGLALGGGLLAWLTGQLG